jgi:hypothetical protein
MNHVKQRATRQRHCWTKERENLLVAIILIKINNFRSLSCETKDMAILSLMVFIACDLMKLQQHAILVYLIVFSSLVVDRDPKTPKDGYVNDSFNNDMSFVSQLRVLHNRLLAFSDLCLPRGLKRLSGTPKLHAAVASSDRKLWRP